MKTWKMRPESGLQRGTWSVVITSQHSLPMEEEVLRNIVAVTLEREGIGAGEVSILFCDDPTITALNKAYRGQDQPTDVLAFPQAQEGLDPVPGPPRPPGTVPPLGDVVISVDTALRQAASYGWEVEQELALLVIHGILHLSGHEDEEPTARRALEEAEEQVFQALFGQTVRREEKT